MGASAKIIDKVEHKEIILILSQQILEEYNKVLGYNEIKDKVKYKELEMKKAMLKIGIIAEIIDVNSKLNVVKDDPADNKIIECAVDGNVDFIVSKDKHLLNIKEYQKIRIVTPEEFLKLRIPLQ